MVGYSQSVNKYISFKKLKKKVHFLRNKPSAIPYVTSYYKETGVFVYNIINLRNLKVGFIRLLLTQSLKKVI